MRRRWLVAIVALVALAAGGPLLFAAGNDYLTQAAVEILVLGLLVLSVELAWGQAGIFTLGQAVFFGIGAYTTGLLATNQGVTDLVLLVSASVASGLGAALLLGAFLFTGRGTTALYVALFTLAISYVAERVGTSWAAVGAANGIPGLPYPTLFGSPVTTAPSMFYVALAAAGAGLLLTVLMVSSRFGLVMNAVRDDEERVEYLGYRRVRVQVLVFSVSGALAGAGGSLFALADGFVSPSFLGVGLSAMAVLWVVLGGRGTVFGPLVALIVVQVLDIRLREVAPTGWPVFEGCLLLAAIVFLPRGLMSLGGVLANRRWGTTRSPLRESA